MIPSGSGSKLGCRLCAGPERSRYDAKLNQTDLKWRDGKGVLHRVTNGKKWEIENRVSCPDDKHVVINRVTGKPAEY